MEIQKLLVLLCSDRGNNITMWRDVGQCIYNINPEYLDHWKSFTNVCGGKFDDEAHEQVWRTMTKTNHGIATLHMFAMNDNPEQYHALIEKNLKKQMKLVIQNITTLDVAKLVLIKYPVRFKCVSIKKNKWFEFKNHRWHEMEETHNIRMIMANEIVNDFLKLQTHYSNLAKDKSEFGKYRYIDLAYKISKVIHQLYRSAFKNMVIKDIADLVYDPEFLNNLNENTHLICFEDGVYDLNNRVFRAGQPDDYISFSTGYNYVHTITDNSIIDEIVEYIDNFGQNVTPKLIKILNDCVRGCNESTELNILYGPYSCGKSMFILLIKYLLGDYFKYTENFTVGTYGSQKSVAVLNFDSLKSYKGIRFCYLDEMHNEQKIHTTAIKIIKEMIKYDYHFNPQFRCFTTSSILPHEYADEPPTVNIEFDKKFVGDLRIENLQEKFRKWAPVLMHLILSGWSFIKNN
ncbi:putative helicase [Tupanvirus soda lake]|uniref:Helicase n=2 Tax=Tupanvirus TaxID=2094720 RepID=A0AC62AAD0_9VIRU|nr:putative helicase [Tupanvirus soda lake]QKU34747.1 putative helicase [Tupanvirus soda lake]